MNTSKTKNNASVWDLLVEFVLPVFFAVAICICRNAMIASEVPKAGYLVAGIAISVIWVSALTRVALSKKNFLVLAFGAAATILLCIELYWLSTAYDAFLYMLTYVDILLLIGCWVVAWDQDQE